MKPARILIATMFITVADGFAGSPASPSVASEGADRIEPFFLSEAAFSFDADYDRDGHGSALEWRVRSGFLIPLPDAPLPGRNLGAWKLRLGLDWHRFEFDHSGGLPLPERLQSVSAILAMELHVGNQIGALLQVRPGVYFEDNAGGDAWNCPVLLGFGYRLNDRITLAVMGRYDNFAKNPIIGGIGFVWKISDTLTLTAIAPEPRITWQATEHFALWAGGEFGGGNFRTSKRGDAIVDYTDYRAFLGATWDSGRWKIEAAAGASIEREWDYHRDDRRYHTDEAAPFVRVSARTTW